MKMRILAISALTCWLLAGAGWVRAQQNAIQPPPKISPKSHLSLELQILDAALDSVDGWSTSRLMQFPRTIEDDPILGRRPSPARISITFAAEAGLRAAAVYELRKHHHPKIADALLIGDVPLEAVCITNNLILLKRLSR